MNNQSFGTIKLLVLGLPPRSPRKKCHSDVALVETHRVYYREGNGASSQRLWPSDVALVETHRVYYREGNSASSQRLWPV
jgi:hypothetical protein